MNNQYFLGIDCGSVSVKLAIVNKRMEVIYHSYKRSNGNPIGTLKDLLKKAYQADDIRKIDFFSGIYATGSGRFLVEQILQAFPHNEITSHGKAAKFYYPKAKTVIEIGGQDSKLMLLDDREIIDSQMNDICAAGTGSFIDQQAYRMGLSTAELSQTAMESTNPSKISGRCSVFAKTDMIHLQQDGVPAKDIAYGLCLAVARTYVETLVKGRKIVTPVLFQGGVAQNAGVLRAFRELLQLNKKDIIVPEYHEVMGAIGSIFCGIEKNQFCKMDRDYLLCMLDKEVVQLKRNKLKKLDEKRIIKRDVPLTDVGSGIYIGIDIGSVSVKMAGINENSQLVFKYYITNHSNPIEALKECFKVFQKNNKNKYKILGVGVTGSGRDYISKCIGADLVKNEITAQAAGTRYLYPQADVIIEIGGQDSKYIRMENGCVVDFTMNKTCAAGTGSFLAEQADRLQVDINDFSDLAFLSEDPLSVGSRCTVFMETDCIHFQQNGVKKCDIVAGLSYSIATNYLEKVAQNKSFHGKICIQGGIAYNLSVVAALSHVLDKEITILPHHEVSGAIGMAILTKEKNNGESTFVGFDFEMRIIDKKQVTCKDCSNNCVLQVTRFQEGARTISGAICDKYEQNTKDISKNTLNVIEERKKIFEKYTPSVTNKKKKIGIPRFLLFYELYPFWYRFWSELGYDIILSDYMSKEIYQKSIHKIPVDTCYPIRSTYGLIDNLVEKSVDYIYLPYVRNMEDEFYETKYSHNCQYIQQLPDMIKAAMPYAPILTHTVSFKAGRGQNLESYFELGKLLGENKKDICSAYDAAIQELHEFKSQSLKIGNHALHSMADFDKIFILIAHPYIIHDSFFNLEIVKRLMKIGIPVITADLLPLQDDYIDHSRLDLHWKTNNRAVNAVHFITTYNKTHKTTLLPVFITQFGCAADSMLTPYIKNLLGENMWLEIEVDEHNSITGILTRCEAYWDSIPSNYKFKDSVFNISMLDVSGSKLSKIRAENKTIYIYPICEAVNAFPVVFEKHGIKSRLIPETNDITNALGKKYANEKHCRTYQVMLGDYLALTREDYFEPDYSCILMFDYDEACRLSLFKSLHHKIISEDISHNIDLISVLIDDAKEWLTEFGIEIAMDLFGAMLCADYLHRYFFEIRTFEKVKGAADEAYSLGKNLLYKQIKAGRTLSGFKTAMNILKSVEKIERVTVPIGITGDGFTRVHKYGMDPIFAQIEDLGGQIILPPSWNDFISFGSYIRNSKLINEKRYIGAGVNMILSEGLAVLRKYIESIAKNYSEHFIEPTNKEIVFYSKNYVNCDITPVIPSMFISKSADWIRKKSILGLVNAYGFNCCLGKITTPCINKLRRDMDDIPMFTFVDDGLEQTNTHTRIEAFMEQVWNKKHNYRSLRI